MSNYLVPVYVVYGSVSVVLTMWLARVLSTNGAVFLRDVFEKQSGLAEAVNRLLVVGFYLFNLGCAALILKASPTTSRVAAIETLAWKLGLLLMSLAAMHFINLYIFHRIRRRSQQPVQAPAARYGWNPNAYAVAAHPAPPSPLARPGAVQSAFEMHEQRAQRSDTKATVPV